MAKILFYQAKTETDAKRKAELLKKSGYKIKITPTGKDFHVWGEFTTTDRGLSYVGKPKKK